MCRLKIYSAMRNQFNLMPVVIGSTTGLQVKSA